MRLVAVLWGLAVLVFPRPSAGMTPSELEAGLAREAGWYANVAAARAAEAADDPALIPAMYAGFVASKRGTLREDPDIHERLLIALEDRPAAEVVAALKAAPMPPELAVDVDLHHRWLDALAADPRGFSALRVVQGDGLNVFLAEGAVVLPPRPDVPVPGGDADVSTPVGSFAVPADRLPRHPDAWWPRLLVGLLLGVGGLVVLAGRVRSTRRFVFPILAMLLAPAGVVGLEVALTAAGVAPLAAVRPNFNLGGGEAGARWFADVDRDPSSLKMVKNNARAQRIEKVPAGVRVAALGGSSVRGKGDLVEYSWPSVLERRLRACAPSDTPVEVINAGADGALSDDLVGVATQLLDEADPDVIVVYTGYNDFVFVPLLTRFEGYSPERMGLRYLLGRTRTAHLGARLTGRLGGAPVAGSSAPTAPAAAPSEAEVADMRVLLANNLSQNLRRIATLAGKAGAEVVFVTQGQNEDLCGPGSLNGQAEWDRACFPAEARTTVLQAASASGVTVVDAAAALRADAGGATVGWSHFWDEIHPGRRGSSVVGEAVAATVSERLWGGSARPCDGPIPAR